MPPLGKVPRRGLQRAVVLAMIAVVIFFVALTYAYLSRHGLARRVAGYDWLTAPLVELLSANTLLLLASSLALRRARQWLDVVRIRPTLRWLAAAIGLGLAFVAGQALVWFLLWGAGVYVASAPNSGFFYFFTLAHALHLVAGLALLAYAFALAWSGRLRAPSSLPLDLAAIVWHTLDVTWIYLYLVLLFWR